MNELTLYRERIVFRGIINIPIEYRTEENKLIYTIKNAVISFRNLTLKKAQRGLIIEVIRCVPAHSPMFPADIWYFRVLNLNVFWTPGPVKNSDRFEKIDAFIRVFNYGNRFDRI